jgi:glycosyltransferase involved in cell wall biosynthesis
MVFKTVAHDPPWISVIMPTLNEAKNLPFVLPRIPRWVHEIIIVDGHSTDGTTEVARDLRPEVRIVHQMGCGKGDALRAGFLAATGDILVMMDADGSTDPDEIPAFIGLLRSGADFVKGSRFMQGGGSADMTPIRYLGNWGLRLVARALFGGKYTDLCYGYNAFWVHALPAVFPDVDGFEVETAMNVRALVEGLRVAEVPSYEADRIYGESHLRVIPDGWRVLRFMMQEYLRRQRQVSPASKGHPEYHELPWGGD